MITYRQLIESIKTSSQVIKRFDYMGERVEINRAFEAIVDGEVICSSNSLEEACALAKDVIDSLTIQLTEEQIVQKLRPFYDAKSITSGLVEFYKTKLENNEFFVSEAVASLKQLNSFGKFEYELKDGSVVAIDEETQNLIQDSITDKYDIVDYMSESLDNFKRVIRDIRS